MVSLDPIRNFPVELQNLILKRDNYECVICFNSNDLQIDHIVPYSKGGQTVKTNGQTLCKYCNASKRDLSQLEWENSQGYKKRKEWAIRNNPDLAANTGIIREEIKTVRGIKVKYFYDGNEKIGYYNMNAKNLHVFLGKDETRLFSFVKQQGFTPQNIQVDVKQSVSKSTEKKSDWNESGEGIVFNKVKKEAIVPDSVPVEIIKILKDKGYAIYIKALL